MSMQTITAPLAHVRSDANLLVRNVSATSTPHTYRSVFKVDGTHPYLYENPAIANHVSGTTFVDMGRQLLKAITHLYYGTPIDSRFVLHKIDLEFLRWAKIDVDIEVVVGVVLDAERSSPERSTFVASLKWTQEGRPIARADSSFTTFSAEVEEKLMSRQYAQRPFVPAHASL